MNQQLFNLHSDFWKSRSWEINPLSICTWFLKFVFHEIDFWTWFFVYFKLDFFCLSSLKKIKFEIDEKTISKIKFKNQFHEIKIFKNQVQIDGGNVYLKLKWKKSLKLSFSQFPNIMLLLYTKPDQLAKGQLISKGLLLSSNSSKKRTNEFGFLPISIMIELIRSFFGGIWG